MSTPWSKINAIFFDKIEEDGDFFDYYNMTAEESMALAEKRAESCLKEAAARLLLECDVDPSLFAYNEEEKIFLEDLTDIEINLLASLQYEAYVARDVAKLKVWQVNFVPSDLNVFSPNEARKTFMEMYNAIKAENLNKLDKYKSKDRITNRLNMIDYSSYDEE